MEIKCPDCNQYISASSSACSHCGRAMTELPVASKPARVACSDGNCTGGVGDNGICGRCRRTPEEINSEIKNKKPEPQKTNPREGVRYHSLWGKIINRMGWKGGLGVIFFVVIALKLLNSPAPSTKTNTYNSTPSAPATKQATEKKANDDPAQEASSEWTWKHIYNGGESQFYYDKPHLKTPDQTGSFYHETKFIVINSTGTMVVGARVICSSEMITFGGSVQRYDGSGEFANLLSSNPATWDEWKKTNEPQYKALIRNICAKQ